MSRLDAAVRVSAIVSMLVIAAAVLLLVVSWRQHNPPCPSSLTKDVCYEASTR